MPTIDLDEYIRWEESLTEAEKEQHRRESMARFQETLRRFNEYNLLAARDALSVFNEAPSAYLQTVLDTITESTRIPAVQLAQSLSKLSRVQLDVREINTNMTVSVPTHPPRPQLEPHGLEESLHSVEVAVDRMSNTLTDIHEEVSVLREEKMEKPEKSERSSAQQVMLMVISAVIAEVIADWIRGQPPEYQLETIEFIRNVLTEIMGMAK